MERHLGGSGPDLTD